MFSGDGLLTIIVYDEKRRGGYFKVGIYRGWGSTSRYG